MSYDPQLTDLLSELPTQTFSGDVFRATPRSVDPLAPSYNGGRWASTNSCRVLYTSLERDGALAEVAFHWSQFTPPPSKPVTLHRLGVETERTLRLIYADLEQLDVEESLYHTTNYERTQSIGEAVEFLGFDGLMVPSARWDCEHLVIFPNQLSDTDIQLVVLEKEIVDWKDWIKDKSYKVGINGA
ncbi:RES domain-containing protein [bacterium endosymbiont of Escarpia laminata]|nr:MAG: RES domain-containing protein [bacterium endosymbiont of Escarpia laminata]RLJ19336.1 MAG: RES domain-containing protein [bacterium endosymbiont of Escarpia laminata]